MWITHFSASKLRLPSQHIHWLIISYFGPKCKVFQVPFPGLPRHLVYRKSSTPGVGGEWIMCPLKQKKHTGDPVCFLSLILVSDRVY